MSRDQYTGWFYGVALSWDLIQDAQLRDALREDVRAIANNLMKNDLALTAAFAGPAKVHFNLNPDVLIDEPITAQSWAQMDDFPLNLIAKSTPYSPALAAQIQTIKFPAMRGGEALRAMISSPWRSASPGTLPCPYRRDVLLAN